MILLTLSIVIFLLACLAPKLGAKQIHLLNSRILRVLHTPFRASLFVGVLAFFISAGVGITFGIAHPRVHDEYSYLLAGDTYAHGSLTNPPHPEWQHFETFHVIQQPTYISKYPPGQGLLLAIGEIIWHPILGVWFGVGLACGAFCWLLSARMPLGWAIYGGVCIAFHPGIQGWAQTYLNGTLALFGACLTLGAALRLSQKPRWQSGVVFSVGCAILALSRMYEGAVFAALISLPLMIALLRQRIFLKTLLSTLPVFGLLTAFLLYDNFRVTGNVWKLPYVVHEETYGYTPLFLFQQPRTDLTYRHAVMQRFHAGQSFREYTLQQTTEGLQEATKAKLLRLFTWIFHAPILWVGLVGLLLVLRRFHAWLCLLGIACFLPFVLITTWFFTHYAAPVTALILYILFLGVRRISVIRIRGGNVGRAFVRGMLPVSIAAFFVAPPKPYAGLPERLNVIAQLQKLGGKSLVIVRYKKSHNVHEEWVYNEANIDGGKNRMGARARQRKRFLTAQVLRGSAHFSARAG